MNKTNKIIQVVLLMIFFYQAIIVNATEKKSNTINSFAKIATKREVYIFLGTGFSTIVSDDNSFAQTLKAEGANFSNNFTGTPFRLVAGFDVVGYKGLVAQMGYYNLGDFINSTKKITKPNGELYEFTSQRGISFIYTGIAKYFYFNPYFIPFISGGIYFNSGNYIIKQSIGKITTRFSKKISGLGFLLSIGNRFILGENFFIDIDYSYLGKYKKQIVSSHDFKAISLQGNNSNEYELPAVKVDAFFISLVYKLD